MFARCGEAGEKNHTIANKNHRRRGLHIIHALLCLGMSLSY
jgi:hypothetical protein